MAPSFKTILLLAILSPLVASNNGDSTEPDENAKLALASNQLAFKLLQTVYSQGNAFFCPVSIFIALGMLYQGARNETAEEIRRVLSYDVAGLDDENLNQNIQKLLASGLQSPGQYKLDIANALVLQKQYPVAEEYKEILKKYYDAIIQEVDFSKENAKAVEEINNWVSNKTEGKIPKLLDSLSPETVLVLLNAVYFKAAWKSKFHPSDTKDQPFYNNGLDEVIVPMMHDQKRAFYREDRNFKALKLEYSGRNISMVILLPNVTDGLTELENELTVSKLNDIVSGMDHVTVNVDLPKFNLEDSKDLTNTLKNLGMKRAFSNAANFGGISEQNLKVSKVIHKSVVEVNENGTVAAGATSIEMIPISLPLNVYRFRADHPFLFFIRDEITGMILFSGRVTKF